MQAPNAIVTAPNTLVTAPNAIVTIPNTLVTAPNVLVTAPNACASRLGREWHKALKRMLKREVLLAVVHLDGDLVLAGHFDDLAHPPSLAQLGPLARWDADETPHRVHHGQGGPLCR